MHCVGGILLAAPLNSRNKPRREGHCLVTAAAEAHAGCLCVWYSCVGSLTRMSSLHREGHWRYTIISTATVPYLPFPPLPFPLLPLHNNPSTTTFPSITLPIGTTLPIATLPITALAPTLLPPNPTKSRHVTITVTFTANVT